MSQNDQQMLLSDHCEYYATMGSNRQIFQPHTLMSAKKITRYFPHQISLKLRNK